MYNYPVTLHRWRCLFFTDITNARCKDTKVFPITFQSNKKITIMFEKPTII